jgi:hypothetical protein
LNLCASFQRYKSEFGSLKSFLEQRADLFAVSGDEVGLAPVGGKRSKSAAAAGGAGGAAGKQKGSKGSSSRSGGAGGKPSSQTDEDSEEEGDEDEDEETAERKGKKSGSSCSCGKVFGLHAQQAQRMLITCMHIDEY